MLVPRLRDDLLELLWTVACGRPLPKEVVWEPGACVGVIMASAGYPAGSSKGDVITGVEQAEREEGVKSVSRRHCPSRRDSGY